MFKCKSSYFVNIYLAMLESRSLGLMLVNNWFMHRVDTLVNLLIYKQRVNSEMFQEGWNCLEQFDWVNSYLEL